MFYKSIFYKSMCYKSNLLQIHVLQIHLLQIHLLQIHLLQIHSTPLHILQYAELISEISTTTIFTSFNFYIFRFSSFRLSGKGEVDVYRMCMCSIVSIPCHGIRSSRHQGVSPARNHQPTNQLVSFAALRDDPNNGCEGDYQPTCRQIKKSR